MIQRLEAQGVSLEEISHALGSQPADLLMRINADLTALQAAIDAAGPESQGLLAAIAGRVHSLITIAPQVPPDLPIS